ncbi:HAD family phosphatase [Streptomyces sp. NPDC005573]|uniref:HAD family hydrolase n=1 Tax=Streptomyces sp. NPDC005573 TaxID=3156890 RepID=UPI0033B560E2
MSAVLRATVFDLDDTLIDTADAWGRVCADFTAVRGHRWRPQDGRALHGNGQWASYVAGLCDGRVDTTDVVEACTDAMVVACAAGQVRALPGAVALVRAARRHGPVAVATASPRRFVHTVLQHLGLDGLMAAVVCGEDVTRAKPAPDPYLRAAASIGLAPARCLAVEDSPTGIRSAAAAGMPVLAVPRRRMTLPADVAHLPAAHAPDAVQALPVLTGLLSGLVARPEPDRPVNGRIPEADTMGIR